MHFARSLQVAALATMIIGTQATAAPVAYGTYYDETAVGVIGVCDNTNACRINFSQLPADKLFMLSKVNCTITSSQPLVLAAAAASATSGGASIGRGVFFNPGQPVFVSSIYFYTFTADVRFLLGQGRFPFLLVQTSVNAVSINMTCGIEGDLVAPIAG